MKRRTNYRTPGKLKAFMCEGGVDCRCFTHMTRRALKRFLSRYYRRKANEAVRQLDLDPADWGTVCQ